MTWEEDGHGRGRQWSLISSDLLASQSSCVDQSIKKEENLGYFQRSICTPELKVGRMFQNPQCERATGIVPPADSFEMGLRSKHK